MLVALQRSPYSLAGWHGALLPLPNNSPHFRPSGLQALALRASLYRLPHILNHEYADEGNGGKRSIAWNKICSVEKIGLRFFGHFFLGGGGGLWNFAQKYYSCSVSKRVLWAVNTPKMRLRSGLRPESRWGSLQRSSRPLALPTPALGSSGLNPRGHLLAMGPCSRRWREWREADGPFHLSRA